MDILSSELIWLGQTLNCDSNIIKVTDKRINSICNLLSSLLSKPYTSARKLAKLNGKLVSTKFVLGDVINLKTRALYKIIEGRSSWDSTLNIFNYPEAQNEILFWSNKIRNLNRRCLDKPLNCVSVFSDASGLVLGA